jgi:hypothetical protein
LKEGRLLKWLSCSAKIGLFHYDDYRLSLSAGPFFVFETSGFRVSVSGAPFGAKLIS